MANKTITEFPAVSTPADTDELLVSQAGVTKKATRLQMAAGVQTNLDTHEADVSNPHAVTKTQAGLGNVSDDAQLKIDSDLGDIGSAANARTNLDVPSNTDLTGHTGDTANPHTVTKSQVSLGNVTNDVQLKTASDLADVASADTARDNLGVKHIHTWNVAGVLSALAEVGGALIAPRDLVIEKAYIYCKDTGGTSGDTIVDINKNGTTIFTTQANRPTLAYDDGDKKAVSPAPDVTSLAEGDIVTIDIDAIPGTASEDLTVMLICK